MKTVIEIVEYATDEVVKSIEVQPGRDAYRVDDGVNRNLSPDYYTRIVTKEN